MEQHHGISEDQKPKQLDVPMASQVQLFDAISHLPEAQSFPNWASLEMFYNAQKQHVQGVPQESGNAIFNFKFKAPANRSQDSQGHSDAIVGTTSQATNVILPAMLKRQFPTAQDTPLALLPCPHCMQNITISMSHIGKLDNPLAQFLGGQGDEEEEEEKKRAAIEVKPSLEDPGNAPILAEIEKQMQVQSIRYRVQSTGYKVQGPSPPSSLRVRMPFVCSLGSRTLTSEMRRRSLAARR